MGGRIWAIAVNTFRQVLRTKIALVFMGLLAVSLPLMAATATGDGTLKGRLQTFVSYGISLTGFLLSILTISVSVYTLSSDIEKRQLYTVLTKPLRRFELILGKLAGVLLVNLMLLLVFCTLIYAAAVYMPKYTDAPMAQRATAYTEFLTARTSVVPPKPDVSSEVRKTFQRLKQDNRISDEIENNLQSREAFLAKLARQITLSKRAVAPGRDIVWQFDDIGQIKENDTLFIRFKYDVSVNPPDLQVYSEWTIGDDRKPPDQLDTPVYYTERKDSIRTFHELEVPADAVAEDGYLTVRFKNPSQANNTLVIYPLGEGLELLYKADNFTRNYVRACLLVFFRLFFLAVLGILAASFLSMPVAVLLSLAILLIAHISRFGLESFESLARGYGTLYEYTFVPLVKLMPQFDKFSPVEYLVQARLISWSFVSEAAFSMVAVKSLILLVLCIWIFNKREIARITI